MSMFQNLERINLSYYRENDVVTRSALLDNLKSKREEITKHLEEVDELIDMQAEEAAREQQEIIELETKVLNEEAELLEEQAAKLRSRADGKSEVKIKQTTVSKKDIPVPNPGEDIVLTADDVTVVGVSANPPPAKKTTMAAAMAAAIKQ